MGAAMLSFSEAELLEWLAAGLWPLVRISGFVLAAPIIGTRSVPGRAKAVFLIALCFVVVPLAGPAPDYPMLSGPGLLITAQQFIVGVALGLAVRTVFMVLELAGQVIAMQMGLGFAAMVDPQSGNTVPVVGQFYIVVATLLFLALDGHLALVQVLVDSFRVLPVGLDGIGSGGVELMVGWAGWLIAQAVLVALPAVTALLLVNFAFGIMTRAAPQLNIFAVGFPIMILGGMVVIALTLAAVGEQLETLFDYALGNALNLLAAG